MFPGLLFCPYLDFTFTWLATHVGFVQGIKWLILLRHNKQVANRKEVTCAWSQSLPRLLL